MLLGELEPFQLDTLATHLRQVILSLLHEPSFFASSENFRNPHGHFEATCRASRFQVPIASVIIDIVNVVHTSIETETVTA